MTKPHVEYFRTNIHKAINEYTCQIKIDERCQNRIKYQYILIAKRNRNLEIYYICEEHRTYFMETIENSDKMIYIGSFD